MKYSSVSESEWNYAATLDKGRMAVLINPPEADEIISLVASQALEAAAQDKICLKWQVAEFATNDSDTNFKANTYFRIEAKIPVIPESFDLLFNGRNGYRAQYYISVAEGERFNKELVANLTPAICRQNEVTNVALQSTVQASLNGKDSKIWVVGDAKGFSEQEELIAKRWNERNPPAFFSTRLALITPPQMHLKGTFICENDSPNCWIDESKMTRSCDLHHKGSA